MRKLTARRFAHLPEIEAHEIGRPHFRLTNPLAAGLGDYVVQPEWDGYFVAASTACVKQVLFSVPQNNPFTVTGGSTFVKTAQTTSMQLSNQLQAPERILVRGISVFLDNTMNQSDVAQLLSQTLLNFVISNKSFLQVPHLAKLPAGGGAWAQQITTATTTTLSVAGNGLPGSREAFGLMASGTGTQGSDTYFPEIEGVLIAQQQNFFVAIDPTQAAHISASGFTTKATSATPPGIGVNAWVYLEGTKVRAVL